MEMITGSTAMALEIESLRQQLAAALAAIKLKDEKMQRVRLWMTDCSAETVPDSAYIPLIEALAIQPDDPAHGRIEELKAALEIAKKGLRHYENRNAAHGTRNPAAIALDDIAATLKGLK